MPAETRPYPLLKGAAELERLTVQARAWQPAAERLFDEIGVGSGWRCIDLGCGPIGVIDPLSHRVGREGAVVGLDTAPAFLTGSVPSNASLVRGDVFAPPNLGRFDLTHARFLFAPAGRPAKLMTSMAAMTRPGGVVAAQEPDSRSWTLFPRNPWFERLVRVIVAAFGSTGGDFDAGARLEGWFRQFGLGRIQTRASALLLARNDAYLRMPLQMACSVRPVIIARRLLSEAEFNELLSRTEEAISSPRCLCVTFTLVQAWGIRAAVY